MLPIRLCYLIRYAPRHAFVIDFTIRALLIATPSALRLFDASAHSAFTRATLDCMYAMPRAMLVCRHMLDAMLLYQLRDGACAMPMIAAEVHACRHASPLLMPPCLLTCCR